MNNKCRNIASLTLTFLCSLAFQAIAENDSTLKTGNASIDIRKAKQYEDQKAIDIVVRADRIRVPQRSFSYELSLKEYNENRIINEQVLDVSIYLFNPNDLEPEFYDVRTLVKFVEPDSEKGKILLSIYDKIWHYSPDLPSPVLISKQQRLIGLVTNDDIIVANFDNLYISKLVDEEPCGETICYKLELTKRSAQASYPAITYWVEKETYRPYRADYLSTQNRLIKRTFYSDYHENLAEIRSHRIIIEDSTNKENYTAISYSKLRFESLLESNFQKEYLPRLK